ncbi:MAG: HisA/HisF-related TIM barrel protein, partial [Candidatus Omnitrophica bacterium]|nr:HisA/HisF-related TIM barrel protein [Candidatus Omnitrophota bacterium]
IREIREVGFKQFIYTDTQRDGTLQGPDISNIEKILKKSGMEMIFSGGIASLSDIQKLKKLEIYGLYGIIVGKALYEKRFSLKKAIEVVEGKEVKV